MQVCQAWGHHAWSGPHPCLARGESCLGVDALGAWGCDTQHPQGRRLQKPGPLGRFQAALGEAALGEAALGLFGF